MQINNHVPNLETCKRMKELGWDMHPCQFVWDCSYRGEYEVEHTSNHGGYHWGTLSLPAPLLSEILEALPTYYPKDDTYFLVLSKNSGWTVEYACRGGDSLVYCEHESSVEAAALLWIKLVEEGIISSNEKE